jgi:hypothetical protein
MKNARLPLLSSLLITRVKVCHLSMTMKTQKKRMMTKRKRMTRRKYSTKIYKIRLKESRRTLKILRVRLRTGKIV